MSSLSFTVFIRVWIFLFIPVDRGFSDFPQNEPLTTKQLESRKRARDEEDEEMNDAKRPRK